MKAPQDIHNSLLCCVLVAHCKNSIDGQWYCFDDSDVQPISEDDVCKQTGYILFYQRRATIPSWSANSSVGGNAFFLKCIDSSSYNLEMCMFKGDLLCSFSSSIFRFWNSNRAEHDSQKNPYLYLVLAFLCSLSETTYLPPVFPKSFTSRTDDYTKLHNSYSLILMKLDDILRRKH